MAFNFAVMATNATAEPCLTERPPGGRSNSIACLDCLWSYAAREREMLIEDIKKNDPTVVLVDNFSGHWSIWLQEHSDIADLLRDYRVVATVNDIEIRAKAY